MNKDDKNEMGPMAILHRIKHLGKGKVNGKSEKNKNINK